MQPHEIKHDIDDAVAVLIDACDTDDVYWSTLMTGQDSEEAEASGYLMGYRDALAAVQRLVGHGDRDVLANHVAQVFDEMRDAQADVESRSDGQHFWMPDGS